MVLLIRHQIEALDAAVCLTKAGRPQFVASLTRAMYESYVNILGIGWLKVTIGKTQFCPAYNARRFLGFWNLISRKQDQTVEELSVAWSRLGMAPEVARQRRRLLLRRAKASMKTYVGFGPKSTSWFPEGFAGLFRRLWLDEHSPPCFPVQLFALPGGFADWKSLYGSCWGHDSNQVHASVVGLTSRPDDRRGVWPSLDPVSDYTNLESAWMLTALSLYAAADALGKLPAFNIVSRAADHDQSAQSKFTSDDGHLEQHGWPC